MATTHTHDILDPTNPPKRGFTVTLVCSIDQHDVVTNDIDLMAAVTSFVADQVPRFFTAVADCTAEGEIL